ncbi:uncharacterized protein LOC128674018 [Plodia interpunctella]|uniref:uncharacterized protein LOC128674018 n=1 Tax=Plodia interpunctella TaxID=58824 RepID=UPI002368C8AC|nr:uncharacterized protein LOC128674018 [Plodia interpunctella]
MPQRMAVENFQTLHAHVVRSKGDDAQRRHCGCLKTSEKLKELLKSFPSPPPPSPANDDLSVEHSSNPFDVNCMTVKEMYPFTNAVPSRCISAYCTHKRARERYATPRLMEADEALDARDDAFNAQDKKMMRSRTWVMVYDLVQLIQLSVTATALALYYLIYCYMQLVYYTLRSALYFHNADGPMKVTIGVVTITSIIVGFNLLIRMEKAIGVF